MNIIAKTALALTISCLPVAAMAQGTPVDGSVDAPKGAQVLPLYGKANPGKPSDEIATRLMGRETVLRNITYPTLTVVRPDPAKANGAAVIVAPGGGFMMLSMQNEGWRVAEALAAKGITAFVLKYRLNHTPANDGEFFASMSKMFSDVSKAGGKPPAIRDPGAGQDAIAALKLVRSRSTEWGVDPRRVGMIGFSAGAMATLKSVLESPADADPETRAPDFFGYVYGPMNAMTVPADAPPMFAALAMDDPLFGNGDFSIASNWKAAKRPVELHVYQKGGHGFGLGAPGTTSTLMMDEFLAWMDMQGFLTRKEAK